MLLSCENGEWRVSGLVDLPSWYFGGPEPDLVRTLAVYIDIDTARKEESQFARAFVAAYQEGKPLTPGFERRYRLAMLRDRLLVWHVDHRRQSGLLGLAAGTTFRDYVERFLAGYDRFGTLPAESSHSIAPARLGAGARVYGSLGPIARHQFQAALTRFDLGDFVDADPAPEGAQFGHRALVTSSKGKFILRGRPPGPWHFPKEKFGAELLHKSGLPVPYPYLLDESSDIFSWAYALSPGREGLAANSSQLSVGEHLWVARAMGSTLALIHQVTWQFAGEYDMAANTIRPFSEGYPAWFAGDTSSRLKRPPNSGISPATTCRGQMTSSTVPPRLSRWSSSHAS